MSCVEPTELFVDVQEFTSKSSSLVYSSELFPDSISPSSLSSLSTSIWLLSESAEVSTLLKDADEDEEMLTPCVALVTDPARWNWSFRSWVTVGNPTSNLN